MGFTIGSKIVQKALLLTTQEGKGQEQVTTAFLQTKLCDKISELLCLFEQVNWQITGPSGGVKTTSGTVTFLADEFRKNVVVEITSDVVPELEAVYNLRIMSVDGGSDLDLAHNNVTFKIRLVKSWASSVVVYIFARKMGV